MNLVVLELEGFEGSAEVDVSFVDNEQIHAINLEQRQIDAPTDVLSFPLGEDGVYDANPATGAYTATPGIATLVVTGTI